MQFYKNTLYCLRLISSTVMTFDICSKVAYYQFSSFLSIEIKDLYFCFMMLRPTSVVLLLLYNFCYTAREICIFASRGKGIAAPLVSLKKVQEAEDENMQILEGGELTQEEKDKL